jgi:alpha-1,3-rhamnosyl/mannosyltransferase
VNYVLDLRTATEHFPGIGRYGINLARRLPEFLEESERLVIIRDPVRSSYQYRPGSKERIVDILSTPFSLSQQWLIPQALKSFKPCLYHSTYYIMPYRPNAPTILTIHDFIPLLYPGSVSLRARLLFRPLFYLAFSASSGFIAVSQTTLEDFKARFKLGGKKAIVIHHAADPAFYPRSFEEKESVRLKYKLPDRFILYVGSDKPHKNLGNLLKAFAKIKPRVKIPLVLAGPKGHGSRNLMALTSRLGIEDYVYWLGRIPEEELPALYSAATAFVFPSFYEGFGLPVLEAMSCGAPVACSDIPALREVAGEAALYFNPYSIDAIAEAIVELIEDDGLRENLGGKGRIRASLFSWDEIASRTLAFYREVLGGKSYG